MERKKILFVSEMVTLAHLARPLVLMQSLDRARYVPHFACAARNHAFLSGTDAEQWVIHSISSKQFLAALAAGKPVYDEATLAAYVEEDMRVLDLVRPHVVVGDFRLSLSVSARKLRVPYVALSNAYWSPYVAPHYVVPSLPMSATLPIPLANALFLAVRPLAFALHCLPMNRVRRRYGLPSLGYDLRRIYTDADRTLYADVPELFPAHFMPSTHRYLGALSWSPPVELPPWWDSWSATRPLVYVTLGSSGQAELLSQVLAALADLPITVIAATAGHLLPAKVPANAHVAQYLPGEAAAQRANLVICNGGSPTSQQALCAGVPVLGIAANLDQFLNMGGVLRAGAGRLLRADRFARADVRAAVTGMLDSVGVRGQAFRLGQIFARYQAEARFANVLRELA
jgi:UDP:flavonoid glycosyltransferase YjiC (YdhE family)